MDALRLDDDFGPADLEGLGAKVRRVPYIYADNFSGLAAGATKEGSIKVDGDSAFVIDFPLIEANIESAINSSIAGTPLLREPFGDSIGNEIPALGLCTISIQVNARKLMSKPIRCSLWSGVGITPGYPLTKIWVPAGATIQYEFKNGTAISIAAQIAFNGKRIYRHG